MARVYDPSAVEAKWRGKWEQDGVHAVDFARAKKPYYNLVMFPYPSGDKLHVGHWYNFAPADSHGRYMRMRGFDVFEPMGFDAFGLPAENYAIKTGVHPAQSIAQNVETMIAQLKRIGCMYDWDRMVNTSSPEYYRWTQWLFLQMHTHGLAYKKEGNVNWCQSCQTVLAREQAQDGTCERCGTQVIQKPLPQWYWNITRYAEQLLDGLEGLDWPEKTKLMQQHWIGRSEGADITFALDGHAETVTVFTTRPDTLFGVTYVVLAPEHPLVEVITPQSHRGAVRAYREQVQKKNELERTDLNKTKTGVDTGAFALHPVTGQKLPVWVADYVLPHYGTGCVMAVPAHDERDNAFAHIYDLPIREVLQGEDPYGEGVMQHSQFLDGLATPEAKKKMVSWLEDHGKGRLSVTYRLKDWLVSRQRYWGAPIPIVYDPQGNAHPVPEQHLPWLLPTDVEFKPTGESPLRQSREFKERTEKIFGKGWTPEYDTMDTFVCSSFYYLRFLAGNDDRHLVDPHVENRWMPVSMYIGGPEHACMHLIYARFVYKALADFGFVKGTEPFGQLVHQGLITNGGAKMSKSKGNVVSPDAFVDRHGSDVFRMYLMFMGPYTDGGDWSETGIKGVDRFVERLFQLATHKMVKKCEQSKELEQGLHRSIKSITESLDRLQFNTAISALMELLNLAESQENVDEGFVRMVALLLGPLAPHAADELWERAGGTGYVVHQRWPAFDPALLVSDTVTVAVQVNGKVRGQVTLSSAATREEVLAAAKAEPNVARHLTGPVKKEVYVPGRLVSLVV